LPVAAGSSATTEEAGAPETPGATPATGLKVGLAPALTAEPPWGAAAELEAEVDVVLSEATEGCASNDMPWPFSRA
jgi:hypothetical protein